MRSRLPERHYLVDSRPPPRFLQVRGRRCGRGGRKMIQSLEISHFKCFQLARFTMKPLTILTGVNGGGKSTVLQSLLLARAASVPESQDSHSVRLNGPYELALGSARDVLHWAAETPKITITMRESEAGEGWDFRFALPDDEEAPYLSVESAPRTPVPGLADT